MQLRSQHSKRKRAAVPPKKRAADQFKKEEQIKCKKEKQTSSKKRSRSVKKREADQCKKEQQPQLRETSHQEKSPAMKRHEEGTFSHTVNQCAHFDGVRISVWGQLRRNFEKKISAVRNRPIGGPDSMYSRAIEGLLKATGNPFQLKYGRHPSRPRPYIPPFQLTMRSEDAPVTWAQLTDVMGCLFAVVHRYKISFVELTFDTNLAFEVIVRDFQTSARHFRKMQDGEGNRTLYIGSLRSPWQVRIYEKGPRITRVEFALRSKALRALGITHGHELLQLRTADVWRWVSWQELDPFRTGIQVGKKATNPQSRACEVLLRRNPRMLSRLLSSEYRIRTTGLLRLSGVGRAFRQMQAKLVW